MFDRSNNIKLSNELNTNSSITIQECAFFSMHVYDDTTPPPEGWTILYSHHGDDGYKGNIYVKDLLTTNAKVIVAHRGTVLTEAGDIRNDIQVAKGKIPGQCETMLWNMNQEGFRLLDAVYDEDPDYHPVEDPTSPDDPEPNPKRKFISYASTGHSLGAVLSDCYSALNRCAFPSFTFENPGSKPAVQKILIDLLSLPVDMVLELMNEMYQICFAYQAGVNIVNTCNEQVGKVFQLKLPVNYYVTGAEMPLPDEISVLYYLNLYYLCYSLRDQHKIENIYNHIKSDGDMIYVNEFPYGCNGGYAAYLDLQSREEYWKNYILICWDTNAEVKLRFLNDFERYKEDALINIKARYQHVSSLLKAESKSSVSEEIRVKSIIGQSGIFSPSINKEINDFVMVEKNDSEANPPGYEQRCLIM